MSTKKSAAGPKKSLKTRRREKKNIPHGAAHIKSTFNNTIVTTANSAVVTSILRQGGNTLRWDFLTGATTHYWLKSFRISW